MRPRVGSSVSLALALAVGVAAVYPAAARQREAWQIAERLRRLAAASPGAADEAAGAARDATLPISPALLVRVEELDGLLASWQTIGGCGAGAGAASSAGLKWIGRNVTGGLFNVQEQVSYTNLGSSPYDEHNFFVNTYINTDVGQKWNFGIILPFVYKYLNDPLHIAPNAPAVNYSNGGLGDISLLATRRLGRINDTAVTGIVGLPTGTWNATYVPNSYLNQNAQLGFGKPTATLVVDHTIDEVWGLVVLGGVGAWRGGQNKLDNYRAPTAAAYGFAGYFLGPFVPACGLALSGFPTHDRDQNSTQNTPLVSLSGNLSIEWSTDWIALMLAASLPYKYDGVYRGDSGQPRSPWGFMPWTLALGVSVAPF